MIKGLMGGMKSAIYLEHLELAKGRILEHLKGKARRIKFLYSKDDITETDVKRINTEDEHIRAVINFVEDAYTTIAAIQLESQQLREQNERLKNEKQVLFNSAAEWKQEYQKALNSHIQLIETIQRVNAKNEAA